MTHSTQSALGWLCVFTVAAGLGCQSGGPAGLPTEADRLRMYTLMLPEAIKIQPFTKIASFDEDEVPDGVLVVLRPLDRFGDPVKATGLFYFELWTYQNASSERRGERIAFWEQTIDSPDTVSLHWTRAEMYEFQLGWIEGADAIRPDRKYLLTATYRPPWDETIRDEYVMEFHLPAGVREQVTTR